jgi:hypothetical protein
MKLTSVQSQIDWVMYSVVLPDAVTHPDVNTPSIVLVSNNISGQVWEDSNDET